MENFPKIFKLFKKAILWKTQVYFFVCYTKKQYIYAIINSLYNFIIILNVCFFLLIDCQDNNFHNFFSVALFSILQKKNSLHRNCTFSVIIVTGNICCYFSDICNIFSSFSANNVELFWGGFSSNWLKIIALWPRVLAFFPVSCRTAALALLVARTLLK